MNKGLLFLLLAGTFLWAGCGSSSNFNDVSGQQGGIIIPAAPVARDNAYSTNSNTQLVVSAAEGVLSNDSQVNSVITFPTTTTENGTVAGSQDGSFTYTPPANFTGTDTFVYTLTNSFGSSSATVTITVVAVNGFFVDATNGDDGTGSFNNGSPFASVQAAVAAAPIGADIVVRPGNYTGSVTLKNGQRLLGSGSGLVNAQGAVRPQLTGPVVLADGNTLDFLRIEGTNGDAVDGDNRNGGTVTNCEIANTTNTGRGVSAVPGSGTWTVSNNTISGTAGLGVRLNTNNALEMTAIVNNNTITGSGFNAIGFSSENTSRLTAQVHGNTMTGNQAGATFEAFAGDTAIVCLDMENNTSDDVYVFDREATSTLEVEELADGVGFAGNTGGIDNGAVFEPATSVSDGHCGF